jgi:hypothetical protein
MNHLDDLKNALQSPPEFVAGPLDLDTIMTVGGRRRRVRRLAVSATSGLAVAVLLAGGGLLAARDDRGAPGIPPAAATTAPPPATTPTPEPTDSDVRPPLGRVVSTGLPAKQGTWVLYAVTVKEKVLPGTHFGLMLGRRMTDGTFTSDVITNETTGSATARGFHALEGAMNVNGEDIPPFGYYVGPATKITASSGGKTLRAGQAAWSADPSVVFFWFDPAKIRAGKLSNPAAFDRDGKRLYAKKSGFGVG